MKGVNRLHVWLEAINIDVLTLLERKDVGERATERVRREEVYVGDGWRFTWDYFLGGRESK